MPQTGMGVQSPAHHKPLAAHFLEFILETSTQLLFLAWVLRSTSNISPVREGGHVDGSDVDWRRQFRQRQRYPCHGTNLVARFYRFRAPCPLQHHRKTAGRLRIENTSGKQGIEFTQ